MTLDERGSQQRLLEQAHIDRAIYSAWKPVGVTRPRMARDAQIAAFNGISYGLVPQIENDATLGRFQSDILSVAFEPGAANIFICLGWFERRSE